MSDELLDRVEVGPSEDASACVIWLHGLGADGHDFEPIVPELGLPPDTVRFIFPHAPTQPVTLNGGMRMRAWYDLTGIGPDAPEDREGIQANARHIAALIDHEKARGVPAERMIMAGFSQGGAMALHVGLRHPERLAGMIALSSYLPSHETVADEASQANADTPIFMAHGTGDPVLPFELGTNSRDELERQGYNVDWYEYPMQHEVALEEIRALGQWLNRTLGLKG
jgi:phospholipase/carboxylesterase